MIKRCLICKKQFSFFPSRKDTALFCSNKCRGLWLKKEGINPPPRIGIAPWNKGKIGIMPTHAGFQKGKNNPSWNGGSSSFKDKNKSRWRAWREAVFKRDKYTCQNCEKVGGVLHPDHIKCFAHHPKLRFKISNGRTLCKNCHKKTKNYGHHDKNICTGN
ncbi:MAG: hypothetical protein U1E54_03800 [Candidatus Levybacteria bacterium]|nr:hypothetical protein [Candidatus Levybacteria bacterium]